MEGRGAWEAEPAGFCPGCPMGLHACARSALVWRSASGLVSSFQARAPGPSLPDAGAELLVTRPGRSRFFRGPARRSDRLAVLHLNTARQKSWLESRDSILHDLT